MRISPSPASPLVVQRLRLSKPSCSCRTRGRDRSRDEGTRPAAGHNASAASTYLHRAEEVCAAAPSTARLIGPFSVIVIIGRTSTDPLRATGVSNVAPDREIAACAG